METYINKKTDSYTEIEKYIDLEAFRDSVPEFFKDSHDPRSRDNCDYPLSALMVIMLMAVISGANSILAIFDYAVSKQSLIKELLGLEKIPKYGTFWWLITRMKPEQFSSAFYEWVKTEGIAGIPKAIQIDGKTIRGAKNKEGNQNVHLVHAWASQEGMLLGQLKTAEKSNEITAIPELLDKLDIHGATITIDAAGCQKKIIKKIRENGGHYIVAVKENQPKLYDEIEDLFKVAREQNFYYVPNADLFESVEKGHGRIVKRSVAICSDTSGLGDDIKNAWCDLETFIEVTSERTVDAKTSIQKRYYISDLMESAESFGKSIKDHWSVENPLHWVMDVVFREDESRANILYAAENLGTLRRIALNLLNYNKMTNGEFSKLGTAQKRRRIGWGDSSILKEIIYPIFGQLV